MGFNTNYKYDSAIMRYLFEQRNALETEYNENREAVIRDLKRLNYTRQGNEEGERSFTGGEELAELYQKSYVRNYYILRYAYSYEYYRMYHHFLEEPALSEDINVLSVGCGNGIDYWALGKALAKSNNRVQLIEYIGLDRIEWIDRLGMAYMRDQGPRPQYITRDAAEYFQEKAGGAGRLPYNVIVFPKSIGEFEENSFEEICNALRGMAFANDKIHFLISIRKNAGGISPTDEERADKIQDAMEGNGFRVALCRESDDEDGKIQDAEDGFEYPDGVFRFMRRLIEEHDLMWPILSRDYICYRITTFQRV